jgi:predicted flap endonuclease-1-like 5' DNA nuclease
VTSGVHFVDELKALECIQPVAAAKALAEHGIQSMDDLIMLDKTELKELHKLLEEGGTMHHMDLITLRRCAPFIRFT